MIIIIVLTKTYSLAQTSINADSSVTISFKDYKQIYYDYKMCDSIIVDFDNYIKNSNELLIKKDTIILSQKLKIESYKREIAYKDSTLAKTNILLNEAISLKDKTSFKKSTSFLAGFTIAILTVLTFK